VRRPRSRRRRQSAGFTLLELLIAITLLALLTTVLLAGFQLALHAFERHSRRLERSASLLVVYDFLRSRLAGARLIAPVNRLYGPILFDGRAGGLDFVSAAPQGAATGGLYLYSVTFGSGRLSVSWQRFEGMLPATGRESGEAVLLENLRSASFDYYGAPVEEAELAWRDEWRGAFYLPLLLRLNLTFIDGERAPPLVVAPRLRPSRGVPVGSPLPAETPRQ